MGNYQIMIKLATMNEATERRYFGDEIKLLIYPALGSMDNYCNVRYIDIQQQPISPKPNIVNSHCLYITYNIIFISYHI